MVETLNSACYNLNKQRATKSQYDFKNKQTQESMYIVCYLIYILCIVSKLLNNYNSTNVKKIFIHFCILASI